MKNSVKQFLLFTANAMALVFAIAGLLSLVAAMWTAGNDAVETSWLWKIGVTCLILMGLMLLAIGDTDPTQIGNTREEFEKKYPMISSIDISLEHSDKAFEDKPRS